jgi:hypothetical protein
MREKEVKAESKRESLQEMFEGRKSVLTCLRLSFAECE